MKDQHHLEAEQTIAAKKKALEQVQHKVNLGPSPSPVYVRRPNPSCAACSSTTSTMPLVRRSCTTSELVPSVPVSVVPVRVSPPVLPGTLTSLSVRVSLEDLSTPPVLPLPLAERYLVR